MCLCDYVFIKKIRMKFLLFVRVVTIAVIFLFVSLHLWYSLSAMHTVGILFYYD